jgi:spore germination cell wall hydrolase CwlJ-like protein
MKIINILQKLVIKEKVDSEEFKTDSSLPGENMGLTKDDLIVAATLWGEARGEKEIGMQAVANVIRNRAESSGITPKEVVLQPSQFSVWNKTTPDAELNRINSLYKKNPNTENSKMWDAAKQITLQYVKNKGEDITKGAKYYHATSITPNWKMEKYVPTVTINRHIFYKLKA